MDALKQALSGNYKPITSPAPEPAPALARKTARKRATQKAEPKAESKPEKTTPAGSKVSSKVDFQTIVGDRATVIRKWENVTKTIDEVHGDGPLPVARITHIEKRGSTNGEYASWSDDIKTYKEASIPLTLTHEMGHWMDNRGFRGIPEAVAPLRSKRSYASHSPLFKKFIKLAKNSNKIKEIKSAYLLSKSKTYLTSNHEIFARAYAQYIATKSKNPEMLAVLRSRQGKPEDGKGYPDQWDDDDFVPLYEEIENIFLKIGWLKT